MTEEGTTPKIHIDSDWKAEAQAERERLAREEAATAATGSGEKPQEPSTSHALPEASFKSLMGVLASQALMGLGTMKDPQSGGVIVDLDGSRFSIDLLAVLQEKTKANLTKEEEDELRQLLHELRSRYVQVTQLVAQSAAGGAASAAPGGAAINPMSGP